jgi:hypothetical protein
MAGAGYKLFTTGEVLTAAQVNTYLQEQTVMSFADAAARTSALSSVLAEGMMSYLRDTNAVQVYNGSAWVSVGGSSPLTTKGDLYGFSTVDARVPIGTNGQVLTADSAEALGLKWGTPAAGGLTLISTTTPTASASVVTLSSIPSTYKNLLITAQSLDSTGTTLNNVTIQFNGDTTTAYDSSLTGVNQTNATVFAVVGGSSGGMGGFVNIYNYTTGSTTKYFNSVSFGSSLDGGTSASRTNSGTYRSTSAISSITLTLGGGETYLATGSIFLYGVS